MDIQLNFIDGRWQAAVGGATREVINPATGECIGIVADSELMAPGDRPIEIVKDGNVIADLLAKPA